MEEQKNGLLDRLITGYSAYFDVARLPQGEPFAAVAHFHSRSEKYVLVKSATMWAYEGNEHVYIALCQTLDLPLLQQLTTQALEAGLALVKPHSEHMYSYITLLLCCDSIDALAQKELRRTRFHKNFRFKFHGWCDLRIAAVALDTGTTTTNSAGKLLAKTLSAYL